MRFLSDEWIEALQRAAVAHGAVAVGEPAPPLVIEQVVHTDGGRPVRWHLRLDGGSVAVAPGAAPDQPGTHLVRFTTDAATALAILHGDVAAQTAFMRGDLRVGGDTAALVANADALAALDDVFAPVRAETEP